MDEPLAAGGADLGANPAEILLWAVVGCVTIGTELFAKRDKVELVSLTASVDGYMTTDPLKIEGLRLCVHISGKADGGKLVALVEESFEKSPIVGSLKAKPKLEVVVD